MKLAELTKSMVEILNGLGWKKLPTGKRMRYDIIKTKC